MGCYTETKKVGWIRCWGRVLNGGGAFSLSIHLYGRGWYALAMIPLYAQAVNVSEALWGLTYNVWSWDKNVEGMVLVASLQFKMILCKFFPQLGICKYRYSIR